LPPYFAVKVISEGFDTATGFFFGVDGKESDLCNFRYGAVRAMKMNNYNSLKRLVGAPGFEPGASCAQGRRATRLRYAPT
jgi:hypothetical protein